MCKISHALPKEKKGLKRNNISLGNICSHICMYQTASQSLWFTQLLKCLFLNLWSFIFRLDDLSCVNTYKFWTCSENILALTFSHCCFLYGVVWVDSYVLPWICIWLFQERTLTGLYSVTGCSAYQVWLQTSEQVGHRFAKVEM